MVELLKKIKHLELQLKNINIQHIVLHINNVKENKDGYNYIKELITTLTNKDVQNLPIRTHMWECVTHCDTSMMQILLSRGFSFLMDDLKFSVFHTLIEAMIVDPKTTVYKERFDELVFWECTRNNRTGVFKLMDYIGELCCGFISTFEKELLSELFEHIVNKCVVFGFLQWT